MPHLSSSVPYLDADAVLGALSPDQAADAIAAALRGGLDPASDVPRQRMDLDHGQLLLMPATNADATGVKLVTLAPDNASRGLPTIQGAYVLFDHPTLAPVAILDGSALTTLRTPAVSMAAIRPALERLAPASLRVVVFGAGPQGVGHARALRSELGDRIERITHVVRTPERVTRSDVGDAEVASAVGASNVVRQADIVVCATPSRSPLFASDDVRDGCVVVAVGSHEPGARELDGALLGHAQVIVEDVETALRECGDVVLAIAEGQLDRDGLIPMRDIVTGARTPAPGQTMVFKGAGMSWEDLVVARATVAADLATATSIGSS